MRLSANLGFLWPELPLTERIAAAGRAGFGAVELHWPYDTPASDIRAAADRAGVRVLALNSPRGDAAAGEFGMACLAGRGAEFRETVALAVDYARVLGAGAVHVMAGKPADDGWRDRLVKNLRAACDAAVGLTVLIEALNTADNPGYAYATVDAADQIRQAMGRPNLRLMLDAYHEAMGGQAVMCACRRGLSDHSARGACISRGWPGMARLAFVPTRPSFRVPLPPAACHGAAWFGQGVRAVRPLLVCGPNSVGRTWHPVSNRPWPAIALLRPKT